MSYRYWLTTRAGIVLGLIFIVSGLGKLSQQEAFLAIILPNTFLSMAQAVFVARWVPWIELALGLLLVLGIAIKIMASIACLFIAGFIAHNSWLLSQGLGYEPCGCFGTLERITRSQLSTTGSLYLDIGMLALALIILVFHRDRFSAILARFSASADKEV